MSRLCACGCGEPTSMITVNCAPEGLVAGEYRRFLPYHHLRPKKSRIERFMDRVEKQPGNGCWNWLGAVDVYGYGKFVPAKREFLRAHRFAYIELVGPIPEGLVLDHLCRNKRCVNPAHLEPVTDAVNIARGNGVSAVNARKTHCKYGHPLVGDNVMRVKNGRGRECRECRRRHNRLYRERRKEAA